MTKPKKQPPLPTLSKGHQSYKNLTTEEKTIITTLYASGKKPKEISEIVQISSRTIRRIVQKLKNGESLEDKKKGNCGRKPKLRANDLAERVHDDPILSNMTNEELAEELDVSVRKIQYDLNKNDMKSFMRKRKPHLSENNCRKRLNWANEHKEWDINAWRNVIWTDECKILLYGPEKHQRVRRHQGQEKWKLDNLSPTFPNDRMSIMIWACFRGGKRGPIHLVTYGQGDRGLTAKQYISTILEPILKPFYEQETEIIGYPLEVVADGATAHRSKVTKKWHRENNIVMMEWMACSPDLNAIENIWSILKLKVSAWPHLIRTLEELERVVRIIWESLDSHYFDALVETMPRRVEALIKNHGGQTKY